jgi:hypothetical protein
MSVNDPCHTLPPLILLDVLFERANDPLFHPQPRMLTCCSALHCLIMHDAALRERPWLADSLVPPVAAAQPAPGATRMRPLVYVYDIPAWAAARMLQYRAPK